MPIINPDTSNMIDMGAIDSGTYTGTIRSIEFQTSKAGNPMIVPSIDIEVDGKVKTRKTWLVITGEGAYNFDQLLRCCGFSDIADAFKDPSVTNKPEFDTDDLIGCQVNVVINQSEYNGTLRDQISSFLPA